MEAINQGVLKFIYYDFHCREQRLRKVGKQSGDENEKRVKSTSAHRLELKVQESEDSNSSILSF